MAQFMDIGDAARRQFIDAEATFRAHEEARARAKDTRGGMYWKKSGRVGQQYLIRTNMANGQRSLGPRSEETEAIYTSFMARKTASEERLKQLAEAVSQHQRRNRAERVGRVPGIVIDLLNAMDEHEVSQNFTVVGTHALYAYEAAAGVRIDSAALATQDVDFLFDTRKRIKLVTHLGKIDHSILSILKTVDKTFELKDNERHSAVNGGGFSVDFLRREVKEGDTHPMKLSDADELLNAPRFSSMVVSASGAMARMNTIHPSVFVEFKRWLSRRESREAIKRKRDQLQAEIVESLVDEYLPQYKH